jgi:hypothetical protein
VLAESQVILGDQHGFLETSTKYRILFDGGIKKSEYFEDRQKYLLTEIPRLIEVLQQSRTNKFRRASQMLRVKQIPFIVLSGINLE